MEKPRVLIVDDEKLVQDLILYALGKDYNITVTQDGEQALTILAKNHFDLVLLDLKMSYLGGLEVLKKTRKLNYKNMPAVIVISGYLSGQKVKDFIGLGVYTFLQKPFGIKELKNMVAEAINHQSAKV